MIVFKDREVVASDRPARNEEEMQIKRAREKSE
jgi:hypothetical protein